MMIIIIMEIAAMTDMDPSWSPKGVSALKQVGIQAALYYYCRCSGALLGATLRLASSGLCAPVFPVARAVVVSPKLYPWPFSDIRSGGIIFTFYWPMYWDQCSYLCLGKGEFGELRSVLIPADKVILISAA